MLAVFECASFRPGNTLTRFCMAFKVSTKTAKGPLARKVREISGEDPNVCFQCGLCAGSCPMTGEMEIFTRKVMHLLQLGLADGVNGRASLEAMFEDSHH